jgi:DNA-binding PadR family transcriptional regulator
MKERGVLTEPMFYVLMSFLNRDMCGIEITEFIQARTQGRVRLGPGTLYTLLGKFLEEKLIEEVAVEGRKRTYRITEKGRAAYQEEVERLRVCLADAEAMNAGGTP